MLFHFFGKGIDFFVGEEGEVLQVFHHIPVILVEPELVEFVGRGLLRIQPYGAAGGFAEFRAVCLQHEGNGKAVGIMDVFGLPEQFYAVGDVAPLVSTADLELYVVFVIEHLEVDGLEDLVGEFGEGDPRFQTGCHHFLSQHGIDIEELAVVPEKFEEGNLGQPVVVIHHGEAIFAEEFLHLGGEAFCIVLDGFLGLENPFGLPAGGVSDGAGAAADNDDRMVAGQLEPLQDHKGNEMTDVHAVTGGIDATVEGNGFLPYQFVQSFFIGLLVHSATPLQFINNIHGTPPFLFYGFGILPCLSYMTHYNTIERG